MKIKNKITALIWPLFLLTPMMVTAEGGNPGAGGYNYQFGTTLLTQEPED